MIQGQTIDHAGTASEREILAATGYSDKAINYYLTKPHMGILSDADQITEMVGSCGDTMGISIKVEDGIIVDAKYQVLGCPGAVSSAMAAVDLIKGKSIEYARTIDDGDIFRLLERLPSKKHECIQLAAKSLQKALDDYANKS
ncbi:MAG: iron-sulfur cluster assembly scaffold protein [Thermodesulfobacteriota bacterium]|nr:iron-sulfur cluster assembly scaffold protein [Thermodesulfobacteriota bacterium]